jgi:hypothetical protein
MPCPAFPRCAPLLPVLAALACGSAGGDPAQGTSSSGGPGDASTTDDPVGTDDGPGTTAPAGTDDGSSTADPPGSTGAADSTGDAPPVGVPVVVAVGDGGWLASSCDGGQSFTHVAFSDEIDDHSPWTAFAGLAHGGDAFVAGFGWGAPGHLLRSTDGRTWQDLGPESFLVDGVATPYDSWTAGVAHTGTQFVAFASTRWGSVDGQTWTPTAIELPPGSDQLRQLRGFPEAGLLFASLESQSGNGHAVGNFVAVSEDEGLTWQEGQGYTPSCSDGIQHFGDAELRGDTLVVGSHDVCRSLDRGATWEFVGRPTDADIADLFADDANFWAASGSRIWRSDDGAAWTEVADLGVTLRVAASGEGVYAAAQERGTALFWSADGLTWSPSTLDWTPDGATWVRDMVVGVVPACPG